MHAEAVLSLLVAAVPILIVGCAPAAAPAPVSSSAPAPVAPPTPVPASSVPPGVAQVIVNGDTGPAGPVSCTSDDGLTTISIGDSSLGVSVIVTDDAMPAVRSVTIGDVGGVALGFATGTTAQAPNAYRNGGTVIVSGTGSGTDSEDPAHIVESAYRIAVACP